MIQVFKSSFQFKFFERKLQKGDNFAIGANDFIRLRE